MQVNDFITQRQVEREKYWSDRRAKEAGKTSTSSTSTSISATTATTATTATKGAYSVQITSPQTDASPKPKTAAEGYGSFYTTSPNGEKLAALRKQNDELMKKRGVL